MRKRIVLMLMAAALLLLAVGCGADGANGTTSGTEQTDPVPGALYFWNTDEAMDETWRALAAAYQKKTGTAIRVVTAERLPETLAGDTAPTLLCGSGAAELEALSGQLLDLSETGVYRQMTTDKYNRTEESSQVLAIACRREAYGLLVNETLLEKADHSIRELMDYGMLVMLASDIHGRSGNLGFDAFCPLSAGEAEELTGQLANAALYYEFRDGQITAVPDTIRGSYLPAGRNFLELLKTCGGGLREADGTALEAFARGEAVFLPVSTASLAALTDPEGFAMDSEGLTLLPLYCGIEEEENGGLWSGPVSWWAVNAGAHEENIEAALDFLNWVVTEEAGTDALAPRQSRQLYRLVPSGTEERATVEWVLSYLPAPESWLAGVEGAMEAFLAGEWGWDDVEAAFTGGWTD